MPQPTSSTRMPGCSCSPASSCDDTAAPPGLMKPRPNTRSYRAMLVSLYCCVSRKVRWSGGRGCGVVTCVVVVKRQAGQGRAGVCMEGGRGARQQGGELVVCGLRQLQVVGVSTCSPACLAHSATLVPAAHPNPTNQPTLVNFQQIWFWFFLTVTYVSTHLQHTSSKCAAMLSGPGSSTPSKMAK